MWGRVVGAAVIVAASTWVPATVSAQPTLVPATFDLPVTGGAPTLERLGIRPGDRAVALPLMARALHGAAAVNMSASLAATFAEIFGSASTAAPPSVPPGPPAVVLAPMSETFWRRLLQLDGEADLFAAIVRDRGALLLAAGAMSSDGDTRAWLEKEPAFAAEIVKLWPGAFAVAAPALSIADEGVRVPGGDAAASAWEALAGAPAGDALSFLRRLLNRDEGRLARFFATLRQLDDPTRDALLAPLEGETPADALQRLYDAARRAESVRPPDVYPYQLTNADLPSVVRGLGRIDPARPPATAGLWPALLERRVNSRSEAAELLASEPASSAYAATVRAVLNGPYRDRRQRLTTIALADRIWRGDAGADEQADAVYALAQFPRYQALLLTLDRIDVLSPGTWAAAVDAARRADSGTGTGRAERLTWFQGAIALVERARLAGSLGAAEADAVVRTLADKVVEDDDIRSVVTSWILNDLMPALPPLVRPDALTGRTAYESRILQAFGGRVSADAPLISWEDLEYAVDVAAAEHERILRIRELVPSPGLDAALESGSGQALAAALRALAYVPALGDPDGPVTLSPDVALRHTFGPAGGRAAREHAWATPVERSGTGTSWHVEGSLLGLDLALARIALRRISMDTMPPLPTINLNDQLTLARTAVAMRPLALSDELRDRIAEALERGRTRLAEARADPAALMGLAREVDMSRAARLTLPWTLDRHPEAVTRLFGLRDLFWLGRNGLDARALDAWGVLGDSLDGRLVSRFCPPVAWDVMAGRPDTGMLATQTPDLNLRLAEDTARLDLPAALVPAILLYLTQDYWFEVEARFADDWPAMVRAAAAMESWRIEDYVAALGSRGPLRPR